MSEPWLDVAVVVRGLRLEVRTDAPVVGISGPSGAGKTSLVRVLAGVDRARGVVRVFGEPWEALPAWQRGVGWVPQESLLFPHLSVRDNLAYARGEVDDAVVGWLGLAGLLDRAPRHLSGGERQRVALGRALFSRPRLLLLDEAFAALDRALRAEVSRRVAAWAAERDVRVVLVTHDEADLAVFGADRWSLEGGALSRAPQPGPPRPTG